MTTPQARARVGDYVHIRCKLINTTEGSTSNLYPGVQLPGPGNPKVELKNLDVVKVEQGFRKGDWVKYKDGDSTGEIVHISPESIEPVQAWIKLAGKETLATRDVRSVYRIEGPKA